MEKLTKGGRGRGEEEGGRGREKEEGGERGDFLILWYKKRWFKEN